MDQAVGEANVFIHLCPENYDIVKLVSSINKDERVGGETG